MQPSDRRQFGRVDLDVTALGLGTASIGNIFKEVSEETSDAVITRAWEAGIRHFDAAPFYGHGLAELRCGHSLRWKNRDDFLLSSKVGRILKPRKRGEINFAPWKNAAAFEWTFDYSYDGIMRSFEDSLQRLALERMDICYIHDIDTFTRGADQPQVFEEAMGGAWKALASLREQGLVKAIGVGVNEWEVCQAALLRHDFDCFLLAGRYTLLEQGALDTFLPLCEERGVAVVVGGGFNSGILATGAQEGARYNYAPAPAVILDKVRKIEALCLRYHVPLPAAALQFVVAHPAIATFMAGARSVEQLNQNLHWFTYDIPEDFWAELKSQGLLHAQAPTPE